MLTPLAIGSHVTVLGRTPTPAILVKALAEVRPNLVICVPLILEKIYRKMIVPMITKKPIRWILAVPMLDRAIYSRIRSRLVEAFGGNFEEVIIGGAPLNPEVEDFLYRIRFPFTVGYGMTECAPLISYTPWRSFIPGSAGRTLQGIMEAKIVRDDPNASEGEIVVRGQNVMAGYYKNPEATESAIDSDGWLHTGDMGHLGGPQNQTIFIRGRYKTMILSANGQNIYPEEIEAKLNNMPYVSESLVVDRDGRLVALVFPDADAVSAGKLSDKELETAMNMNIIELNKLVAPYEQVTKMELVKEEFVKTPKRSIKRFMYK
jgi:long-chain acyl-CoA synthetase